MNASPELSKALAVADRLWIAADGSVHLPPTMQAELRKLTPQHGHCRRKLPPLAEADVARIRELRRTGHTYIEIVKRTGISYGRVFKALTRERGN